MDLCCIVSECFYWCSILLSIIYSYYELPDGGAHYSRGGEWSAKVRGLRLQGQEILGYLATSGGMLPHAGKCDPQRLFLRPFDSGSRLPFIVMMAYCAKCMYTSILHISKCVHTLWQGHIPMHAKFFAAFPCCVCVCVCMFWFPNVYVAASGSAWSSGRGGKWCTFGLVMHMTKGFSIDARASCTLNFGTCSFWVRESNWERAARSRIEQDSAPLVFRCTIKLSTEIRWYINNERGPKPLPGKEDTVTPGSRDFCIHPGTPLFRAFHVQIGTAKCLSPSSVH